MSGVRRAVRSVVVAGALCFAVACGHRNEIPVVLPLSGEEHAAGEQLRAGIELAELIAAADFDTPHPRVRWFDTRSDDSHTADLLARLDPGGGLRTVILGVDHGTLTRIAAAGLPERTLLVTPVAGSVGMPDTPPRQLSLVDPEDALKRTIPNFLEKARRPLEWRPAVVVMFESSGLDGDRARLSRWWRRVQDHVTWARATDGDIGAQVLGLVSDHCDSTVVLVTADRSNTEAVVQALAEAGRDDVVVSTHCLFAVCEPADSLLGEGQLLLVAPASLGEAEPLSPELRDRWLRVHQTPMPTLSAGQLAAVAEHWGPYSPYGYDAYALASAVARQQQPPSMRGLLKVSGTPGYLGFLELREDELFARSAAVYVVDNGRFVSAKQRTKSTTPLPSSPYTPSPEETREILSVVALGKATNPQVGNLCVAIGGEDPPPGFFEEVRRQAAARNDGRSHAVLSPMSECQLDRKTARVRNTRRGWRAGQLFLPSSPVFTDQNTTVVEFRTYEGNLSSSTARAEFRRCNGRWVATHAALLLVS